jgi:hypothetical protein
MRPLIRLDHPVGYQIGARSYPFCNATLRHAFSALNAALATFS